MTTAQVVKTSVTVNKNSPIQDYIHLDDQTQPAFDMKDDAQIEEECPRTIYYLTYTRLHCKKLSNQKSTFGGQLHTNVCILSTQALHWCLFSHYKLDSQICLHTVTITAQIALGHTVIINLISWTK